MPRSVPLSACFILAVLGADGCDDPSRYAAGDALGSCSVSEGQCLDACPDYPRILACPTSQVCDFRDGQCHAPSADVLLGNGTRCGQFNCLAGLQCAQGAVCLLKPYSSQRICDVVGNCWGWVGNVRAPIAPSPSPAANIAGFPDGELLDVFATYDPTRGHLLRLVFRGDGELIVVNVDSQGQVQNRVATQGFVVDAAIDVGTLSWIAEVDDNFVLYEYTGSTTASRGLQTLSERPLLFGRRFPTSGRLHCVLENSNAVRCGSQYVGVSGGSASVAAAEIFSRSSPAQITRRGDNEEQEVHEVSALLLARGTRLTLAPVAFSSLAQESTWANLPAPAFALVRDMSGLVYVSLVDGQVLELSSEGEIQRVVMNHPGRRGRIAISPDGYLYFVAAGETDGAAPILERVRLPDGFF